VKDTRSIRYRVVLLFGVVNDEFAANRIELMPTHFLQSLVTILFFKFSAESDSDRILEIS